MRELVMFRGKPIAEVSESDLRLAIDRLRQALTTRLEDFVVSGVHWPSSMYLYEYELIASLEDELNRRSQEEPTA